MRAVTIDNIQLILSHPVELDVQWIGSPHLRMQLAAAWTRVDQSDIPLNPRLLGKPGIGKTTLAYAVAREMGREVYIFQCTMDTRPEDLIVTPVISQDNKISYHASPLVTAMLEGGVCILDEGNRMSEKSWASLAPLLDHRRYVESIVAGIKIPAHPEFRACCTMNDDASTYEVPEYIQSRLQPQIELEFPDKEAERAILKFNVPYSPDQLLEQAAHFLQRAHRFDLPYTSRDGINILRYSVKKATLTGGEPRSFFEEAIGGVLGSAGVDFLNGRLPATPKAAPESEDENMFYDPEDDENFKGNDDEDDEDNRRRRPRR
ncbi:MAG: AAA family ATPase [Candidatus Sumerlaeota bacterium]|nr:AAA family ATPase [Candidatus Sumerlaeota bacterium]